MNTNLLHNILNVAIVIVGAMGAFDWTGVGLNPELAVKIVAGLGTLKLVMNALRDGLSGMTKPQPPVQQ
ncbi:MAG: hypothetical protein IT562_10910 [Alphaproteobacteria bacterium]|nr:hypothetical protein [Alphaproteobacteria bacterium]